VRINTTNEEYLHLELFYSKSKILFSIQEIHRMKEKERKKQTLLEQFHCEYFDRQDFVQFH